MFLLSHQMTLADVTESFIRSIQVQLLLAASPQEDNLLGSGTLKSKKY